MKAVHFSSQADLCLQLPVLTPGTDDIDNSFQPPGKMACSGAMTQFAGYPLLTSNTTFTPNGFFDVAVPTLPLPALRVVAFLIRRTLGWSDARGNPLHTVHQLSWKELANGAGVSRSKIGAALNLAIQKHFIECHSSGRANSQGVRFQVAQFELKWSSSREYTADPQRFDGFYQFSGCRTIVPNAFFDHTVKSEPLSVINVIAAVIRESVGWEDKWGFRRQEATLSFSSLQRKTNLNRETVSIALRQAIERGHIRRVEAGEFNSNPARQRPAIYALNWSESPSKAERSLEPTSPTVSGSDQANRTVRSPNPTSIGSSIRPGKRSFDPTSKKIKDQNNKHKQQQRSADGADAALVEELVAHNLSRAAAVRLARSKPDECRRQLEFLQYLPARSNPGGWLRDAIENEHGAPPGYLKAKKQEAGREKRASLEVQRAALQSRKELHRAEFFDYLDRKWGLVRTEHSEAFSSFLECETQERESIARPWFTQKMLEGICREFDRREQQLLRLQKFFSSRPNYGIVILDFDTFCRELEPIQMNT